MKRRRLGEVHRERGNISISALDKSLQEQQGRLVYLGELVLERGVVSKAGLAALAEVTRARTVDCRVKRVDPEALRACATGPSPTLLRSATVLPGLRAAGCHG